MTVKKHLRGVIAGLVCILIVVGYYYYLSNRDTKTTQESQELSTIAKITTKNLDDSYPKTPREVVKLYNEILKCYYNEDCTDEEIEALAGQARKLMDEELLEQNPKDQYLIALKMDIQNYKDAKRTISRSDVCDSGEITYKTVKGSECAYVGASYFMKEENGYIKSYEQYVLRKDDSGNWKILAYKLIDGNGDNIENE